MATAVSLSSASSYTNSYNNHSSHSSSSTPSVNSASDSSHTSSTAENTSFDSNSTNHSIHSISISKPTAAQPPYHNPRYLGSIPFYYPARIDASSQTIPNPYLPSEPDSVPANTSDIPNEPSGSRRFHQATLDTCWDSFQTSCDDLKKNEPWGDDFQVKTSHTFRIYFQNVNSCGLSSGIGKMTTIAKSLSQAECDFINVAQTSINWKILSLRERMKKVTQKHMPINRIVVGNNKYQSEQKTLPGGVAQIISGDWTGRIVQYIHDFRQMGRWCGTKIRLRNDRHLYIICAYRVCEQHINQIGVETAYAQQHYMMALANIHNSDPRQLFIDDLTKAINQWKTDNDEILIVMDANEQIGRSKAGLTSLMRECKLIDLFHHHHGIQPDFPTYERGSRRLDYAIGSATLLPFITRCGYLPFFQGIQSDHRGLFLDISHELIDGLTRLERTPSRYLHSEYRQEVFKYKQYVTREFNSHNIGRKASDLCSVSDPIKRDDPKYLKSLNALDSLVISIQLKAEQKCCKRRTKYDWSDDIYHTKRILTFWNLKRKSIKFKRDVIKITQDIYCSLPDPYKQYIDIAGNNPVTNWNRTKKKLQNLIVQHRTMIATIQRESVANEAQFTGSSAEQIIFKQEQRKQDKRLFATLRQHFHPTTRSGIAHVLLPDKDKNDKPTDIPEQAETWRTETEPTEVLRQLFSRNIQHFGQASGTPFTTDPLVHKFGYVGVTFSGEQLIQEGTIPFSKESVSTPTYDVLQRLADTTRSKPIHHDLIDFESFRKAIRKWRESTSTSPSGRHLGHYKSLISLDSNSSKYTEGDPDPGPMILRDMYHIANAAFNSGLSLDRWKHVTTCMIEKLPGVPRINKLRVIHLYEADYNAFLKLAWQRGVVWSAHQNGLLNAAQAGSRPHHTSIEVVMSKEQKYLNSRLTRLPMATMDNDAKSCYDRVVASLALLISHHFGVPEEICHTVGETLRTMKFKLRTALGDSEEFYSHSKEQPIHGVGQGGTASPALWLLVSSILFDCYQTKASGMTMSDPTGQYSLQQWLEAIVDDTSIFTNVDKNATIATLVKTLEQDAQYWENLLSVSGGCLELSKCFYYVLAWTFTDKGDVVPMSNAEIDLISDKIRLQEFGKSDLTTIASKAPHEAHKTLGVWKTMIGDDSTHISTLVKRSDNMAAIVGTSGMHPYQAEVAVRMIYTPAMGYSLPAVNVSETVLNKIQNRAMASFIPAMGYNKSTPQAIMYGPKEYGGASIPHLHTECRIQQITTLMMHLRAKTDLGRLFMINLNWIQLTVGVGTSFLENTNPIPYVDNWFFGIQQFLRHINGKLVIHDLYIPTLERQHDQFLMGTVPSHTPALSANQLRYFNQWRLYFQVQTLSDITSARGDCILDVYLTHPTADTINQLRSDRQSKYDWPYQPPPISTATFKLWKRILKNCFTHPDGKTLRRSLGSWIIPSDQFQSHWQAYLTKDYQSLIVRQDSCLRVYNVISKRTTTTIIYDDTISSIIDLLPLGCFPVSIQHTANAIVVLHFKQKNVYDDKGASNPTDIQQAISQAPFWQRCMLQHFHIPDPQFLQQCLENDSTFLLVSDGGMKDGIGSFGVVAGTHVAPLYSIEGPALGNPTLMHAYRSEGYGMMASFNFLHLFVTTHKINIPLSKKVTVYCDNLSLVNIVNEALTHGVYPRMHLKPEFDVIMQILHDVKLLEKQNIQLSIEHVRGHQDKTIEYVNLSRPAQLNVDADSHATNYLTQGPTFPYSELPSNPVSLYLNDMIITRSHKSCMRSSSTSPNLREYFLKRFLWRPSIPDLIWWEIHGSALESFPKNDRRRLRKFIFGWLPTNERLFSYKQTPDERCPTCNHICETHAHLLKCSHKSCQIIKDKWYTTFESFLQNSRYTPPLVKQILYDQIVSETSSIKPKTLPTLSQHIKTAYNDQANIGWQHLMQGRFALSWGNIIASHLHASHIPEKEMSALVWGRRVLKEIFNLVLMLWNNRNNAAHGSSRTLESPLTRSRLMAQIAALQQSNPEVLYTERDFIHRSISELETYSLSYLKAWHKQAVTIINVNKTRISNSPFQVRQNPPITRYFNPVRPPDFCIPVTISDADANNEPVVFIELSQ